MPTSQLLSYAMPFLLLAIFYFMLIRPQKKRDQQLKNMRNSLRAGDHVTTIGGIHGRVTKVTENTVTIVTSEEKTKLVFEKWAIGRVVLPEDAKEKRNEPEKVQEEVLDTTQTNVEVQVGSEEVAQENDDATTEEK